MPAKRFVCALGLALLLLLAPAVAVNAVTCNPNAQTCSQKYQVTESFFGSGGTLQACSASGAYCSKQSAGELGAGKACDPSDKYCAQAGFNTNREAYLEVSIGTPDVDVGVLQSNETHVGAATFQVKSYLAQGYVVQTVSPGPKNGNYTMQLMSSGAGAAGTEGFGMNLKQNSCPAASSFSGTGNCSGSLGAEAAQDPDTTFSFGHPATGYDTAGSYKYHDGDIIAQSSSSSGFTEYTISYIFNISNVTPGGTYTMNQSLVATSTF